MKMKVNLKKIVKIFFFFFFFLLFKAEKEEKFGLIDSPNWTVVELETCWIYLYKTSTGGQIACLISFEIKLLLFIFFSKYLSKLKSKAGFDGSKR